MVRKINVHYYYYYFDLAVYTMLRKFGQYGFVISGDI